MSNQASGILMIVLDYAALLLYNLRAFSFCDSILEMGQNNRMAKPLSLLINCLLLAVIYLLKLPMLLCFVFVYLAMLLQFCMMFQGKPAVYLFGSGTFLFHLMNVQMIVSSIYILLFHITTKEEFFEYYHSAVFLTLLVVVAFLEVFRRTIQQEALRLLLKNHGQLLFVTTSLMLINVYLLILSVFYNSQAYTPMAALFLLCTGVLVFGAFYTSFQHGVRMSVLLEYEIKSRVLEKELKQSYKDLGALRSAAFTDALTDIHNRRYGMEALEGLLKEGRPCCVCFLDIDHLKEVNDRFGHSEGDHYILSAVRALSGALTSSNILARLGGDEFLLLLPGWKKEKAGELLEGVRTALRSSTDQYRASISYGIWELAPDAGLTASEVLQRADRKMYEYKETHREAQ